MTVATWYALVGAAVLAIGMHSLIETAQILRRIIALNLMGSGVFLILIGLGCRVPGATDAGPDPVPQAMVLTGIVVSVSATALALALLRRYHEVTGHRVLPEDDQGDAGAGAAPDRLPTAEPAASPSQVSGASDAG